jgi:Protein of unknown function (DUF2281)
MSDTFENIVHHLDEISSQEKFVLRELLDRQLAVNGKNEVDVGDVASFGWAKGRITISDDFDAPLDDFKDYVD